MYLEIYYGHLTVLIISVRLLLMISNSLIKIRTDDSMLSVMSILLVVFHVFLTDISC